MAMGKLRLATVLALTALLATAAGAAAQDPPDLPKAPVQDLFSLWGTALWKGAAACAAITALTVALSLWSFHNGADSDDDTLDMVVLAGADQLTETW